MKDSTIIIWYVVIALLIVGSIVWEIATWRECLETNSWWYCMRVIGK